MSDLVSSDPPSLPLQVPPLLCVTLYPTWHRNMEKKGRNISGKIYNAVKMSLFTLPPTAHRAGVAAGLMQPAMRSSREPRIPVEVKRYEVYKLKTIGKFQYTSCIISELEETNERFSAVKAGETASQWI